MDRIILSRGVSSGVFFGSGAAVYATVGVVAIAAYVKLKQVNADFWTGLGRQVQVDIRLKLANRIANVDLGTLDSRSVNTLANSIRSNLADIERGFDGAGDLAFTIANTAVLGTLFFALAPRLIWIPAAAVAAMVFHVRQRHLALQDRHRQASDDRNLADRRLTELIEGITTIKSFGLQRRSLTAIEDAARTHQVSSLAAAKFASRDSQRLLLITLLGVSAVTLTAGVSVAAGTMTVGTQISLMMIAGHLFFPFTHLGPPLDNVNRGLAAYRSLDKAAQLRQEIDDGQTTPSPDGPQTSILLDNVTFTYPTGSAPVLRGLTLAIPAGKTIGIVGSSGSGKSTIAKLLLRHYDPTGGSIQIDGDDIRNFGRSDLRQLFSTVDQRSFLFEDTIANNIAVGRLERTDTRISTAAKVAAVDDFIHSLPSGYDTDIGARGAKLSDGQRQRLLIARAVLLPAPVLILDEATSNLDAVTEQLVLANMQAQASGRTIIVIAHRLAAVKDADQIFVLDHGQVAEVGKHAELLKRRGIYHTLWRSQQSGKQTELPETGGVR